jgi:spectinomycin phosphotransferase
MTADQWRAFGRALRAVHDSDIGDRLPGRLRHETFGLPSAAAVREALEGATRYAGGSAAARRLAAVLRAESGRIGAILDRANQLSDTLGKRHHELVPCHADIHAGNLLLADDGRLFLVDWDGPMLAPRERDLLFVVGSRIARKVEPHEEAWFFEGYGQVDVDREAIVYYRYERILEDIGEFARSVFDDADQSEASRDVQARLASSFFERGGIVEAVEQPRWVTD